MIKVTDIHREGKIEMFTVVDRNESYKIAVMVDMRCDGVKIPLINGVEDKASCSLIGINQIQRLKRMAGESA